MTVFFDVVDEIKSITEVISSAFYFLMQCLGNFYFIFWKIVVLHVWVSLGSDVLDRTLHEALPQLCSGFLKHLRARAHTQ